MSNCMTFQCCMVDDDVVFRSSNELNNITRHSNTNANNLINEIEAKYNLYVNGSLKCTPQEGTIIINNYNSRQKLYNMFLSTN